MSMQKPMSPYRKSGARPEPSLGNDIVEYDNAAYLRLVSAIQELWSVGGDAAKVRCDSALADFREEETANARRARHNRSIK